MNHLLRMLSNNRGELDLGGKETLTAAEVKTLFDKNIQSEVEKAVQPKIDSIVQSRLEQQARKFDGYDDLKKFKEEHTKEADAATQKQLEDKGKYDEAMKLHNEKIAELSGVITQKDTAISSMNIGNALTNEIIAQGGYLEETLAMLRSSAEIKEGVVTIKGKDANGLDQSFSVADGVKSFLAKKPHLVKTNVNVGGGGSGAGGAGDGGKGGEGGDLTALNELLTKQTFANDFKGAGETRAKIKTLAATKGVTISSGIVA